MRSRSGVACDSPRSFAPPHHNGGVERSRCVDRLPIDISKMVVLPYAVVGQAGRRRSRPSHVLGSASERYGQGLQRTSGRRCPNGLALVGGSPGKGGHCVTLGDTVRPASP